MVKQGHKSEEKNHFATPQGILTVCYWHGWKGPSSSSPPPQDSIKMYETWGELMASAEAHAEAFLK